MILVVVALSVLLVVNAVGAGLLILRMLAHHELQLNVLRSAHPDLTTMTELVGDLCQRIQAPDAAVAQHAAAAYPGDAPQHVPMDDDAAYFESKEQLASRLEAMRLEAMHVGA